MNNKLQIAIDGPAGSGKGTLALVLARKLNAVHVYTGGMYRALTVYCLRNNIDIHDEELVVKSLDSITIDLNTNKDHTTSILLNDEDITDEVSSIKVSNAVPVVAKYKGIRAGMVKKQQEIAEHHRVIIEGRDIATVVLPHADLKIFLTADADIRSKRRFEQLKVKHPEINIEDVKKDMTERDYKDQNRSASPLKPSEDALIIDTTYDTVEDTVDKVINALKERGLE